MFANQYLGLQNMRLVLLSFIDYQLNIFAQFTIYENGLWWIS